MLFTDHRQQPASRAELSHLNEHVARAEWPGGDWIKDVSQPKLCKSSQSCKSLNILLVHVISLTAEAVAGLIPLWEFMCWAHTSAGLRISGLSEAVCVGRTVLLSLARMEMSFRSGFFTLGLSWPHFVPPLSPILLAYKPVTADLACFGMTACCSNAPKMLCNCKVVLY